jgi:hypothetical protein
MPPGLASLTVSPTSVGGGATATGTVRLTGSAPVGGVVVSLRSNNAAASVPASVPAPAGATTIDFANATTPVASAEQVTISATFNGSRNAFVDVAPAPPVEEPEPTPESAPPDQTGTEPEPDGTGDPGAPEAATPAPA